MSLPLAIGACTTEADPVDDPDDIQNALEETNGGIEMVDEPPLFGMSDLFEDADLGDIDTAVTDEIDTDPDVIAMRDAPDAAIYAVRIAWGQFPLDPETPAARNWSGTFRVNRGAIRVLRTIRFEDSDRLLARPGPRAVPFISWTRPHHDGMLLQVIDPTPEADEPLLLGYETPDGEIYSAPLAALLDGPIVEDVDDLGNRVVAVALRRPVDVCNHGFLAGRWHKVGPHFGVLMGRVTGRDGELKGHLRGIYGERSSGEKVFFGKYINLEGRFRGVFAGHYGDGHFAGRWHNRAGEIGRLGGHYRESLPGPRVGGHFLGRWAETSCDLDVGPGTDVPGE